jgi:hypothetical protein
MSPLPDRHAASSLRQRESRGRSPIRLRGQCRHRLSAMSMHVHSQFFESRWRQEVHTWLANSGAGHRRPATRLSPRAICQRVFTRPGSTARAQHEKKSIRHRSSPVRYNRLDVVLRASPLAFSMDCHPGAARRSFFILHSARSPGRVRLGNQSSIAFSDPSDPTHGHAVET